MPHPVLLGWGWGPCSEPCSLFPPRVAETALGSGFPSLRAHRGGAGKSRRFSGYWRPLPWNRAFGFASLSKLRLSNIGSFCVPSFFFEEANPTPGAPGSSPAPPPTPVSSAVCSVPGPHSGLADFPGLLPLSSGPVMMTPILVITPASLLQPLQRSLCPDFSAEMAFRIFTA